MRKKKMEMCDNCGKNPANEPNTCPYDEEVHDSLCNCCNECRQECIWNI